MKESSFIKTELSCPVKVSGLYTVHYFKYGKNFRFAEESHDFWELVYIDSGKAKITSNNKCVNLTQGNAYLHAPNATHTIHTDEEFANSAIISFECKSRILKKLSSKILVLDDYEKTLLNKIINEAKIGFSDKLNDAHLKKMSKNPLAPIGSEQIIKNCIELLFLSILRNAQSIKQNLPEEINLNISSDQIVDSIRKILIEKLDQAEPINLSELSYKLGFSKSYIKSQFKKKTGLSVIKFYINMKIDKAKKLLSQQKYSVSEIADTLGFGSVYYFSRQFKLHTDMSPTEYINSIKADNVL
jgi:AraC-like DNA-binding protein